MKKSSIIDYLACILVKLIGPLIRSLPLGLNFYLGRRLGELFYYFDLKHKAIAYANIKTAFAGKLSSRELNNLTKEFYRSFGQDIMEIFLIPLVDKEYINKYITLEKVENIFEGFKKGKGIILVAVHAGSWEFSSAICSNLGFPFNFFVRGQRYPRLNSLLNLYRKQKGCKLIQREDQTRQLIKALRNNEAIGMTVDQGGKAGIPVKFFGKYASMPSGAIRLALKYGSAIVPVFYTRVRGPYIKAHIEPPFEIKKTGDLEKDVTYNLEALTRTYEKYIFKYPREYFWSYRIWKYTTEKNILIISDGKTGHLRQAEALARLVEDYLKEKGISSNINIVEIKFKNKFSRSALTISSIFSGKYSCQGCQWCLRSFLEDGVYRQLSAIKPDIVISCGSSVAPVNYIISKENVAKSITIMRPSFLSTNRFDLVVMSRHDLPPGRKNVVAIEGALNLINADYLKEQADNLTNRVSLNKKAALGVLIGGDSKDFHLSESLIKELSVQLKNSVKELDAELLLTTSRRTPLAAEHLLKEEFADHPRCKLLVIANEKNIPQAVGGILALSKIIIVSPESISMISEAVNSGKYVVVIDSPDISRKHRRFLDLFAENKYIYPVKPADLSEKIKEIWRQEPQISYLKDNLVVSDAIKRIL